MSCCHPTPHPIGRFSAHFGPLWPIVGLLGQQVQHLDQSSYSHMGVSKQRTGEGVYAMKNCQVFDGSVCVGGGDRGLVGGVFLSYFAICGIVSVAPRNPCDWM